MDEITALASHYPARKLAAAEKSRWLADYAETLADVDMLDVRIACRLWRESDEKRMPTPGQLLAKAKVGRGAGAGSRLPVTVTLALHDAMVEACGEPFAISYLHGAVLQGGVLQPRTSIAADRLRGSSEAMRVLAAHGVLIAEPLARHERAPIGEIPDPALIGPPRWPLGGKPVATTPEEREKVKAALAELIAHLAAHLKNWNRLPGENEAQFAERVWPNRRIDRVRGYVDPEFDRICAPPAATWSKPQEPATTGWSAKPEDVTVSDVTPAMRKLMGLPPPRQDLPPHEGEDFASDDYEDDEAFP